MKQKSLLNFFQTGASTSRPGLGDGSSEEEASRTAPAKGRRSAREESTQKATKRRTNTTLQSSDSDQAPKDDESESSDVGAIGFEKASVSSVVEDDETVLSPKRPAGTPRKVRKLRAESVERISATEDSDGEPEVIGVPVYWKKKDGAATKPRKAVIPAASDDDEPQPKRRKLVKGVRPPTPEEDLMDEVEADSKH